MSRPRKPFLSIALEVDDDAIEAIAARKGIRQLQPITPRESSGVGLAPNTQQPVVTPCSESVTSVDRAGQGSADAAICSRACGGRTTADNAHAATRPPLRQGRSSRLRHARAQDPRRPRRRHHQSSCSRLSINLRYRSGPRISSRTVAAGEGEKYRCSVRQLVLIWHSLTAPSACDRVVRPRREPSGG